MYAHTFYFKALIGIVALMLLWSDAAVAQNETPYLVWGSSNMTPQNRLNLGSATTPLNHTITSKSVSATQRQKAQNRQNNITRQHTSPYITQEAPSEPKIKLTPLEEQYSSRILDDVTLFGYYDLFSNQDNRNSSALPNNTAMFSPYYQASKPYISEQTKRTHLPAGQFQDDFILSYGDEIKVVFRGNSTEEKNYTIAADGLLIIENLPPITAAGRKLSDVKRVISDYIEQSYNLDAHISLNSIRQIDVLIIGEVKKPGRQTLTVFHSLLDALIDAGGINKTGSLRKVKLVRQGRSTIIDLYGLLMHGSTHMDLSLRDGDRIIVPPIGPTLAVTGAVNRPAIYEIRGSHKGIDRHKDFNTERLTLTETLDLAAGITTPGRNRFMHLHPDASGKETVKEVHDFNIDTFAAGSILIVAQDDHIRAGTVELSGHTRRPGLA